MKTVSLSGSPRASVGKKDAAENRRLGLIPAVIYGGDTQTHLTMKTLEIEKLVYNPNVYKIDLTVDGTVHHVIIQDIQFHPVTDKILHVDFLQVIPGKETKVALPLRVTGNSIGVRNGGRLAINFRKLTIKGMIETFPEDITVDITKLRIGQSIRIKHINLEGVKLLHPADAVVVSVKTARGANVAGQDEEEAEEAAAAAGGSAE
ncbi:MAG: 50S ribosomal protein L25 [Luteibaculaceae bacterium]